MKQKRIRFERTLNIDVFMDGIRKFIKSHTHINTWPQWVKDEDRSSLKKLIIPYEYQASSKLKLVNYDTEVARRLNLGEYSYAFYDMQHQTI
jgi:hypothetical protein